jgi:hypothetical protein
VIELLLLPFVVVFWLGFFAVVVAVPLAPIALLAVAVNGARAAAGRHRLGLRALRASDAERAVTLQRLREHFATGRLTLPELEERTDAAIAAQTPVDLLALVEDLPPVAPPYAYAMRWLRLAAAIDLTLGGLVAVAAPTTAWRYLGISILAAGFGIWHVSRDPLRRAQLLLLVLAGKLVAAVAAAAAVTAGLAALGLDLICWPVLAAFVRQSAQAAGGWRSFAGGAKPGASAL